MKLEALLGMPSDFGVQWSPALPGSSTVEKPEYDIATIKALTPFVSGLDFAVVGSDGSGSGLGLEVVRVRVKTKIVSPHGGATAVLELAAMPGTTQALCVTIIAAFHGWKADSCFGYTIQSGSSEWTRLGTQVTRLLEDGKMPPGMVCLDHESAPKLRITASAAGVQVSDWSGMQVNQKLHPYFWEAPPAELGATAPAQPPAPRLNPKVVSDALAAFKRFG